MAHAFQYPCEDSEPERVPRRPGAANMGGEMYEVGIATILLLRGYFESSGFSLSTNVDGAGEFDDLKFTHISKNSHEQYTTYFQLKHKGNAEGKAVNTAALCATSGDFSLLHYFNSFCEIQERFGLSDNDTFVIYTNIRMGSISGAQAQSFNSFLDTGGTIINLTETEEQRRAFKQLQAYRSALEDIAETNDYAEERIKQKLNSFAQMGHCKRLLKSLNAKTRNSMKERQFPTLLCQQVQTELNDATWTRFISKLNFFTSQVCVDHLDILIKETLVKYLGTDHLFQELKYEMTEWWRKQGYILSNRHVPFWSAIIKRHIVQLVALSTKKLSHLSDIEFKESVQMSGTVMQIVTKGCTEVSCLQVQQSLRDVGYIIIDSGTLVSRTSEVLSAWEFMPWCSVLVVEGPLDDGGICEKVVEILKGSSEKKLLLVSNSFNSKLNEHFKIQVQNERFNLCQLSAKSQSRILDCEIDFQGSLVKLGTLAEKETIQDAVDADFLLRLVSKENTIQIGERIPDIDSSYIDRTLNRKEYISKKIFNDNNIKLAISGISKQDVRQLVPPGERVIQFKYQSSGERVNNVYKTISKEIFSRYFVINGQDDFTNLCKYNKEKDIHWIHWSNGRFNWILSNVRLDAIMKYLEEDVASYDETESFLKLSHRMVLILGEPGIGKSEELRYLTSYLKVIDPTTWVVRVILNQYTRYLNDKYTTVRELLLKAGNFNTDLEAQLFNYQLDNGGNLIVLFDGLDEISPKHTEQVNSMLKFLLSRNVRKIWVTSRPFMWEILRREFHVLPFRFYPFTENDQRELLIKLWTVPEGCEEHLTVFVDNLLGITKESLKVSVTNFFDIPLHLKMLADVFKGRASSFYVNWTPSLSPTLDMLNLYDDFVGIKWDVYCDKNNLDITNSEVYILCKNKKKESLDGLMNCALVEILKEDIEKLNDKKEILLRNSDFLDKVATGTEISGFVTHVQIGRAVFVHHTFTEYFAATWFSNNYHSNLEYFREFYINRKFGRVRQFFDRILSRDKELHSSVVNCDIDKVREILSANNGEVNDVDRGGRRALYLAVSNFLNIPENQHNLNQVYYKYFWLSTDNYSKSIFKCGINNDVFSRLEIVKVLLAHGADCNISDNILSWSLLRFAEHIKIWSLVDLLLAHAANPRDLTFFKTHFGDKEFFKNLLEAATIDECTHLMAFLFHRGLIKDGHYFECNRTILHNAAFLGHMQLIQFLVDGKSDVNAPDWDGLTPLMSAAYSGEEKVAMKLLQHGANPHSKDVDLNSVIHYAAAGNLQNFVEKLVLEFECDINTKNTMGYSPLPVALWTGHEEMALKLIQLGACGDLDSGMHFAAWKNLPNVVDLLLESKYYVDGSHNETATPLIWTIAAGNQEMAIKLLLLGANPNAMDANGNSVMYYAVKKNLPCVVDLLMELQCDIDACNNKGETPLMKAVVSYDEEMAIKLLEHGANPVLQDYKGDNVMHYGAARDLPKFWERLLKMECVLDELDESNDKGQTSLMCVCAAGLNENLAIALLEHGSNPNAVDNRGNNVIHYAVRKHLLNFLNCLFKFDCEINEKNVDGKTPLTYAVIKGYENLAIYLIKKVGASPHVTDIKGNGLLHYAVRCPNLVDCLLTKGCDIDQTNLEGETPLMVAALTGDEAAAMALLVHGANPNTTDVRGNNVMHYAVAEKLPNLVDKLLRVQCNFQESNFEGESPIIMAAAISCERMAKQLLAHGANPNARDQKGNSVLHYAVKNNLPGLVNFLLTRKCDIGGDNNKGKTPLQKALRCGNEQLVIRLLQSGADYDEQDDRGNSVTHYAAEMDMRLLVDWLLQMGCNIDRHNSEGETPLMRALARRNEQIATTLLLHGANPEATSKSGCRVMDYAERNQVLPTFQDLLVTHFKTSSVRATIVSHELTQPGTRGVRRTLAHFNLPNFKNWFVKPDHNEKP